MRAGGAGSCDGDMGQGGQIVQRIAFGIEIARQLPVADTCLHCHGLLLPIQLQHLVAVGKRDDVLRTVRDAIKGVPRAQRSQRVALRYDLLYLRQALRIVPARGAVGIVAGPVRLLFAQQDAPIVSNFCFPLSFSRSSPVLLQGVIFDAEIRFIPLYPGFARQ